MIKKKDNIFINHFLLCYTSKEILSGVELLFLFLYLKPGAGHSIHNGSIVNHSMRNISFFGPKIVLPTSKYLSTVFYNANVANVA